MVTVRNGAFPIKTGDMVQFYFDFETNYFDEYGYRRGANDDAVDLNQDTNTKRKRDYAERSLGMTTANERKHNIAYPKACNILTCDRPLDRARIFGKAMSNAGAWDMVDILIGRQSI